MGQENRSNLGVAKNVYGQLMNLFGKGPKAVQITV